MSKSSITPWRSIDDLLEVRRDLYRLDEHGADHRRRAVNRILAWKLRNGSLPHAVESTALLVDAILNHANSQHDTSLYSVRAVYTAAFTRFVTGFCDIGRARERSLDPSSMLDISRQIGMPAEFVTLRHEATHEDLPGIQRLVSATEQSLSWLWHVYWSKLENHMQGKPVSTRRQQAEEQQGLIDATRSLLKNYRKMRRDLLKTESARPQKSAAKWPSSILEQQCTAILANEDGRSAMAVDILVTEDLLSPSNRTLASSMDGAFMIWDPLLQNSYAKYSGLLGYLITRILDRFTALSDDQDVESEAAMLWLTHLTQYPARHPISAHGSHIHSLIDANRYRVQILQSCCLFPRSWTQRLGNALLEISDDEITEIWRDLLHASQTHGIREVKAGEKNSVSRELRATPSLSNVRSLPWTKSSVRPKLPIGMAS